jgi:hypothetical protein
MGEMADHDRELFESGEFPEADPQQLRFDYLRWLKNRFESNPNLDVMTCHKYPEFGTISRWQIDGVIANYEEGLEYSETDFTVNKHYEAAQEVLQGKRELPTVEEWFKKVFDPNDLIGKRMRVKVGINQAHLNGVHYFVRSGEDDKTYVGIDDLSGVQRQLLDSFDPQLDMMGLYAEKDVEACSSMYEIGKTYTELGDRMSQVDMLRREARRMLEQAERLEGIPTEDVFADGQVIKFKKDWSGYTAYRFAAIKIDDFWYTTAQANRFASGRLSWKALTDLLDVDADSIEVLDMDSAIPIKDYVAGVQHELELESSKDQVSDDK